MCTNVVASQWAINAHRRINFKRRAQESRAGCNNPGTVHPCVTLNNDVIHAASFSKSAAARRLRGPSPIRTEVGEVFIAISCFTWRDVAAGEFHWLPPTMFYLPII